MELFHKMISGFLGIPERQISSTLHLLGEGATIPFISRYRKEVTGGLDEVQIEQIKEQHDKLCDIAKRKETILGTITEQGKLTAELEKRINDTWNPTELEDIYLPYKPKRKTRAEAARQKGLEPLATILMLQRENNLDARAASFVKGEVKDVEDALKGARDIIAEQVNEDERARNAVRNQFARQAEISAKVVKGKEEEAAKYRDYFDFSEPLKRCTSHRLLAIRRAESEGLLKVSITPDDEACIERLERQFVRGNNECSRQVNEATIDAYKRLLKPSIETEFAAQSKEKADDEAIRPGTAQRLDLAAEQLELVAGVQEIPRPRAHQAAHGQVQLGLDLPQQVGVGRQAAHGQCAAKFQPVRSPLLCGAGGGEAVNADFQQLHIRSHPFAFSPLYHRLWDTASPARPGLRRACRSYKVHNK